MNPRVRLRMPKWQHITGKSWAKDLLMTFAGTTLSIILTFGTAGYLDRKEQREDGRQAAMMVIHDMENSADLFRKLADLEEKQFNAAQVVLANADKLGELDADTLMLFAEYILHASSKQFVYDEASERIFLSSQDVWKNINNAPFIDAVQEFYHGRRRIYDDLNSQLFFQKPVPQEQYYKFMINNTEVVQDVLPFVKENVHNANVEFYIKYSFARRRYYQTFSDEFTSIANRCKFMMGITDTELAQYVANRTRSGKPVTAKQLVGTWQQQTVEDVEVQNEYRKDHTFTSHIVSYTAYPYYTGLVAFRYTQQGTWEIKGDSLIMVVEPSGEYEIDRSMISYTPDKEALVNSTLASWDEMISASLEARKAEGPLRNAFCAMIDATGDKIELSYPSEDLESDEPIERKFMMRVE